MSNENQKYEDVEVCEACGSAGEIGFMIKEGDDVAEVTIYGESKQLLEAEFEKYAALAKEVSAEVEQDVAELADDAKALVARFKFTCSAEKLIFELKSRSLRR
ncbi:YfcZ/YiiS family protein [Vibrio sp. SCSIO 43136]|uniref:YfcZ/YiiS family protein n=1 Tax=Vibrio sp. SCSIO 43136 TaxID=2819101 RepID=UPI002075FE87|nr:YfcZ/YiiS family protein [Vibrio sp. SCSIO 43136]USD66803.1 YfcZ/YiiS family protein [Vibrio sp. SCSIO 43136]